MLRSVPRIEATHLLVALLLLFCSESRAAQRSAAPEGRTQPAWREISAGAEASEHGWSAYTTLTLAPFGALDADGIRFRSVGGYGRYQYDSGRAFHGVTSFTDLMIGWQSQVGMVTLKGFAGAAGIAHNVTPFDRDNAVTGLDIGFKAALEVWAEISTEVWASVDASWTSAHETYAMRMRGGWRVLPELSAGLEGGVLGNATYDGARGGAFLRYAADWGEVSVSGGVTGDIDNPSAPYATINWLMRY